MRKKIVTTIVIGVVALSFAACSGKGNKSAKNTVTSENKREEKKEPTDLTGTWKSEEVDGSYQEAVITDDTIEINWISDDGNTKSIYWIGSYEAPKESVEQYDWTSVRNKEKTDTAILASGDDSKKFTFEENAISYEVSALGTTTTMRLVQSSKDIPQALNNSTFTNDTLATEEATIKITGTQVIPTDQSYCPYLLILTYDFTNNADNLLQPENTWHKYFTLTQETEATVETLRNPGSLPTSSEYNEADKLRYTDVKPGATIQTIQTYAIYDVSHPVSLAVTDEQSGKELGVIQINLQ